MLPAASQPPDRDRETIRLLQQGDQEGLRRLLQDHGGKVLALLRKEFHPMLDMQDIEDVVSQASLRVWRSGARFDPGRGSLANWFVVIARNCARTLWEQKRRHAALAFVDHFDESQAAAATPAHESEPDEPLSEAARFRLDLQACIEALPPQQRAVLSADLAAGGTAPTAALAAELGSTANSVYVSRNQGRRALRAAMLRLGHDIVAEVRRDRETS